jgi:nucleoside phosphorylase
LRRTFDVVRSIRLAVVAALVAGLLPALSAYAGSSTCTPRVLVVSAMPVELAPLLATETGRSTRTVGDRDYYLGRLAGHDVALMLTGIGPVNARTHVLQALADLRCGSRSGVSAVVFSGVAGGDWIGNVIVPDRWTLDAGKHLVTVDRSMLAVARRVARQPVALEQQVPVGDPACLCLVNPRIAGTISVTHAPKIEVGGAGQTTDPFAGRALGCLPGGGDVVGCAPCPMPGDVTRAPAFLASAVPFVDPAFFSGYAASSAEDPAHYVAEDEETAAVATVAAAARVPFLGFRAVSDGGGDPLMLPGFPVQFFYYRQLAADNAAAATIAFLAAWRSRD